MISKDNVDMLRSECLACKEKAERSLSEMREFYKEAKGFHGMSQMMECKRQIVHLGTAIELCDMFGSMQRHRTIP